MNRRSFMAVALGTLALPISVAAQPARRAPKIGVLVWDSSLMPVYFAESFLQGEYEISEPARSGITPHDLEEGD